jgi:hypothetical protein
MSIDMEALAPCNSTTQFHAGSVCQFRLTIKVPTGGASDMHVELFTSDNVSAVFALLDTPSITVGSNYNVTTVPTPLMVSNFNTTEVTFFYSLNQRISNSHTPIINIIYNLRILILI